MTILINPASKPVAQLYELDGGTIILDQAASTGLAIVVADESNVTPRYALRSVDGNTGLVRLSSASGQMIVRAAEASSLRLSFDKRSEAPADSKASIGLLALGRDGIFVVAEFSDGIEPSSVVIALSGWKIRGGLTSSQGFEWYSEWSLISVDPYGERTIVVETQQQ